ncbi:MAG: hypothetical protein HY909_20660 [Deltaproteobacteria bacterium]|nr:hypothetical protein [Deltaproteobacteria bacterium]
MNFGAALVALGLALVLKVAVMVLGARLLVKVFRARHGAPPRRPWLLVPRRNTPEVRLLTWALVLFYVTELTCGIEIYVIFRSSPWLSSIHSVASGVGMALFALGLFEHLDRELLRFGQPSCLVNRVCRGCTLAEPEGCRMSALLLLLAGFVALAALPPFLASTEPMIADPRRWLLPFPALNAWYDHSFIPWVRSLLPGMDPTGGAYVIREVVNVLEFRVLPAAALVAAVGGVALLRRGSHRAGLRLTLAAAGVLAYVYLELITFRIHGDALAGGVMHEVAELWFLVVVAEYLTRSFGERPSPRPEATPSRGGPPTV